MWNVADIFLMETVIRMHFMNNEKYVFWKFQIKAIFHVWVCGLAPKSRSRQVHTRNALKIDMHIIHETFWTCTTI